MPKRDLAFRTRLMNAGGTLGFAPDPRAPLDWSQLDAFITNPVSMRPRRATSSPCLLEYAGGFLLHTGLPNPGFKKVLQRHGPAWARASLPVIVHLMADRPDETRAMVRELEARENVMAAELGFAPLLADDILILAVEMSTGELPLIVSLPPAQLLRLGPRLLEIGAAAISLAAPRGSLRLNQATVSGRLFGPSLLPHTLETIRTASAVGLPVIAAGGIFDLGAAHALLDAGAAAVQLDIMLWLPDGIKKGLVD